MVDLTNDELLTTTRAVRKRLDLGRPVERSVIIDCLDIAFQSANGSNNQSWEWVIIDDPAMRAKVAEIYKASMLHFLEVIAENPAAYGGFSTGRNKRPDQMSESVYYLNEHFHEIPVLVLPLIRGRPDGLNVFYQAGLWGSIWPAAWNFMLALRSRGLGSSITTLHLWKEREMAELLGIPFEEYTQAAILPVAYTIGTEFKPAVREPASEMARWNRF